MQKALIGVGYTFSMKCPPPPPHSGFTPINCNSSITYPNSYFFRMSELENLQILIIWSRKCVNNKIKYRIFYDFHFLVHYTPIHHFSYIIHLYTISRTLYTYTPFLVHYTPIHHFSYIIHLYTISRTLYTYTRFVVHYTPIHDLSYIMHLYTICRTLYTYTRFVRTLYTYTRFVVHYTPIHDLSYIIYILFYKQLEVA